MKKLTIDGRSVEVDDAATILEACEAAGADVPTLCHDPRLTPYGACRMCLVEVEGQRKLLPACTSPAEDGMVVTTVNDGIRRLRRTVLEFLCVHHPLDCPVCDSAGECNLQDYVFEYGVSENRFKGTKKDYPLDSRSPLVERDLNRCILCAKCVRICREVQGVGAIGLVWRGFDTEVGPPFGETLDCEFCGQCIAVCPVGALTSKTFKFKTRSWILDKTESTCPHCATGCSVTVEARKGKVYRITSETGKGVNNGNLCPKGRFGYEFVNHADRLAEPKVREGQALKPASWDAALGHVVDRIRGITEQYGRDRVAAIGSPRVTNEENYLLQKLMRAGVGNNNVDSIAALSYRKYVNAFKDAFGSVAAAPDYGAILSAKTILVAGSNVTETNPVVGNLILQAKFRNDARVVCVTPRGSKLTRHADQWLRNAVGTDADVLAGLAAHVLSTKLGAAADAEKLEGFADFSRSVATFTPEAVETRTGVKTGDLKALAETFAADGPALVVLSLHSAENAKGLQTYLAALGLSAAAGHSRAGASGVLVMGETCNIQGLLDVGCAPDLLPGLRSVSDAEARKALESEWGRPLSSDPGLDLEGMLGEMESGKLKALYVMGENPLLNFPDTNRVKAALEKLEFLVVQDIFLTETAALAHVVLPASSFAEKAGTVTNSEFRVNSFAPAIEPLGGSRPDWAILSELLARFGVGKAYGSPAEVGAEIARVAPALAPLAEGGAGKRWVEAEKAGTAPALAALSIDGPFQTTDDRPLALLTGSLLNHAGTVTRHSAGLMEVSPKAYAHLSSFDAQEIGVKDGDSVKVSAEKGEVSAEVLVTDAVPPGAVFLPVHFDLPPVNRLTGGPTESGERQPVPVAVSKGK